jgi:hypothetical protein
MVRLSTWNLRDFPKFYVGHFAKNKIALLLNTHQLQIWFAETQTHASLENTLLRTLTSAVYSQAARSTFKSTIFFPQTFVQEFVSACLLFCSFVIVFIMCMC